MFKTDHKKAQATARAGQAATELAVFGAILIFLLGAIVRSAASNGLTQNQNFKVMRMAMLASWNSSKAASISRNSASVLLIEDRLSPDFNKYGDIDRNPYISNGSGTFTYELMYPLDNDEPSANIPLMDIYINGQHFPFTTASFVQNRTLTPPTCASDGPYETPPLTRAQCLQNQCLRNQREWVPQTINENQFDTVVPVPLTTTQSQILAQESSNAAIIFNELVNEGILTLVAGSTTQAGVNAAFTTLPAIFKTWFKGQFPGPDQGAELNGIQSILKNNRYQYKLFYDMAVNGTSAFHVVPRNCATLPCQNHALSTDIVTANSQGVFGAWNNDTYSADMMFDLLRNKDYDAVNQQFGPPVTSCLNSSSLRCNIAWQWYATPATTATSIGLDASNNQYPTYDVDGRLKDVTIYAIRQNGNGTPTISYEDSQGGDIDGTWDSNSCEPKPGLLNDAQIFTFTKDGTYLQIKEGQLYNPETGQVVRSANKRDSVDLVQRMIQLSNNTGRFCNRSGSGLCDGSKGVSCADPNPVELCVSGSSSKDNCFADNNIAMTCYDTSDNMLFVRSRLEDRRGHSWMTDASGQLQVQ